MKRILFSFVLIVSLTTACNHNPGPLYRIERDQKFGYIDTLGNEVIPPQYILAGDFVRDLAYVITDTTRVHEEGTRDYLGMEFPYSVDTLFVTYGFINKNNKFEIKPTLSYYFVKNTRSLWTSIRDDDPLSAESIKRFFDDNIWFSKEGLALFQSKDGKFGYIDRKGDIAIEPIYSEAHYFSDGKAVVKQANGKEEEDPLSALNGLDNKFGCIDANGNTVIDFIYESLDNFLNDRSYGVLRSNKEREPGAAYIIDGAENRYLLDGKGNIISDPLPRIYVYCNFPKDGLAPVYPMFRGGILDTGSFFIDRNGETVTPGRGKTESEIERILSKPHKLTLFPEEGKFLDCSRFVNGYAPVSFDENKWTFVDTDLVVCGNENSDWYFEYAYPFSSGMAAVKLDGKYGYIDTEFNLVIPYQYDEAGYFEGPLAYVSRNKEGIIISSYINKKGQIVWQKVEKDKEYK